MPRKRKPPKNRPDNKHWSYVTGRRGYNRIRVYRDREGAPIRIEWFDNAGRHREVLRTQDGTPVFNEDHAVEYAERAAKAQAKRREAIAARELLGQRPRYTLGQLFEALHRARESSWSEAYQRDQKRYRAFWEGELTKGVSLDRVTPAKVEHLARKAAEANGWSPRTEQSYLRYIVDAFYYASKKLKWIAPEQDLAAVEIPKAKSKGVPYTDDETRKLVPATLKVDLRCAGMAAIAATTGRRLNAIRHRMLTDVARDDLPDRPRMRIVFDPETDKARDQGVSYIEDPNAIAIVEMLMQTPAVQATGLLFPSGDLQRKTPAKRKPIRPEPLIDMLHEAERIAGVKEIKGRAYHGFKRWFATVAEDADAAARQSGTTRATLERIYRGDRPERKGKVSREAGERIWGS